MKKQESTPPAHVSFRSVFEVDGSRLAIGVFNRPLLDEECRRIRAAWEFSPVAGIVDFEVNQKQVSFLTAPVKVAAAWDSVDRLLANSSLAKAS
jgi:hypothetical protein